MSDTRNETHDPALASWVETANAPTTDFPIQNLPYGVFRHRGGAPRVGVAIGDRILDAGTCLTQGFLTGLAAEAAWECSERRLNGLMALGPKHWSALRKALSGLLRADRTTARPEACLHPMSECEMCLPVEIGDYTDFYASIYHATNVGSMFRPDNPLLPNYKWAPIGYHGRASSVVVNGTPVRRPQGQIEDASTGRPVYGPSKLLDYECEVGFFVGPGNPLGRPIPIGEAREHIFGLCLVNDWSARDVQRWEYQPLGPFLAKSFATTISPWVVTMEALEPFRSPAFTRPDSDPQPLVYLDDPVDRERGGIDLTVEVWLASEKMRKQNVAPVRLSRGSFLDMYWTVAQMLAHHASNGCNLRPGDLMASGTVSGKEKDSRGCLLEVTWRGTEPIALPAGESRTFLADGDEVILKGYCERPGARRIGFGECRGVVLPAG